MPAGKSTSVKCPKWCPRQCSAACPSRVQPVCEDILPHELMDEILEAAYAEKTCAAGPVDATMPANQQINKCCTSEPVDSEACDKIALTLPVAVQLLKNWYRDASYEAEDALYDIKSIWNSADGELSRKVCATNRLFIYYLLILAIYIIQICFLVDEKLFEGLCKIIARWNDKAKIF